MWQNIEMILTEETQILLLLGIAETANPLVLIVHVCSFCVSHFGNGTIHSLIQSLKHHLQLHLHYLIRHRSYLINYKIHLMPISSCHPCC